MPTVQLSSLATVAVAIYASDASQVAAMLEAKAVREVSSRFVIGGGGPTRSAADAGSATWVKNTTELVAQLAAEVTHVWMIHDDASPRPDALHALVNAAEQIDASLVGSKVLEADRPSILESVGGATDVYMVADTGLATGELDQEQYDVVRDVAFVPGESVLIRRDLLKGLGGPDRLLPPLTQAIDFAARARLAGGRVAVVPSSEVLHAGTCHATTASWREPAARWRAAAKVYSPWTAAWVVPLALLIGFVDAIGRLGMLDFRPLADFVRGIGWTFKHLPNTVAARRQARKIAQVDDGELFRYQRAGSLTLGRFGADITSWLRARSTHLGLISRLAEERMFWQRSGFGLLVVGLASVFIGFRSLLLSGLPVAGYVLPLPDDPASVIAAYAGGWNPVGFGTGGPGHPAAAAVALVQLVFSESALLVVLIGSVLLGLLGTRRLLRSFGIDGVAAVLGGLAGVGGVVGVGLGSDGYWPILPAVAAATWLASTVIAPWPDGWRHRIGQSGGMAVAAMVVAAFVPLALVGPILLALLWSVFGPRSSMSILVKAAAATVGGLAVLGPWLFWSRAMDILVSGDPLAFTPSLWIAAAVGIGVLLTVLAAAEPQHNVAGVGALLGLFGVVALRLSPGLEISAAGGVLVAIGVGLAVGGVSASLAGSRGAARVVLIAAQVGVVAALLAVGVTIGTGRWGLPADEYSQVRALVAARSGDLPSGRVLFVGSDLPGQARWHEGVPYKVTNGNLSLPEAWLPTYREADRALDGVLSRATDPNVLRPGEALGELGIRWVVVTASSPLDRAFKGKLDLKQLEIGDGAYTVYENVQPAFVARTDAGTPWQLVGATFVGEPSGQVALAVNPTAFGQSDVPVLIDGSDGEIGAPVDASSRLLGWLAVLALFTAGLASVTGLREKS